MLSCRCAAVSLVLLCCCWRVALGDSSSMPRGISRGTTWCGFGNASSSRDAIDGAFTSIDSCCRIHDICPATIGAMTTKFGYYNFRMFTISHCECDEEFRSCLKMASRHGQDHVREKVRKIGNLFFNNALAACFRVERTRVCESWNNRGDCQRHKTEKRIRTFSLKSF